MKTIAEILKNVPAETQLYSPILGECFFKEIYTPSNLIKVTNRSGCIYTFYENGTYADGGEVMLFPSKENREWNTFEKKVKCPFKPFDKVVVRDDAMWHIDFFEQFIAHYKYPYICLKNDWRECLPYNEETATLVGTIPELKTHI